MAKLRSLSPQVRPLTSTTRLLSTDFDDARRQLEWRKWYKTARWQRLRWKCLERDLFTCRMCGLIEADTSQLVADHRQAHRGDPALFWDVGNLQCLCAHCHNSTKQRAERHGG